MSQKLQKDRKLVQEVFDKVYNKYDLMNDIMSFGSHRNWKKILIQMMNPIENQNLIDVGCGTGDVGKLFSDATDSKCRILSIDPNAQMIELGKKKLRNYKTISWQIGSGEKLDVKSNTFDFYTISFGLRNTSDVDKTIKEAYRVLKKGGRFFCLEFSKVENSNLEFFYKKYSQAIPKIGKYIVGDDKPYNYLIQTIDNFLNQDELLDILKKYKFEDCQYLNITGGIVAIHSGWKI